MLIFEQSRPGRRNYSQSPATSAEIAGIPKNLMRKAPPLLPEVSEMDAVRHYTRLSQKNFSIDTQFYPLGSCTMKYNPRACNSLAMDPLLARIKAPESTVRDFSLITNSRHPERCNRRVEYALRRWQGHRAN